MTENLRFRNVESLPKPPGYTHVVEILGPGRLVYFSGQIGQDGSGKLGADFRSQAMQVFDNLGAALRIAGADFRHVVKLNNYLTDLRADLLSFREVRDRYVNPTAPPAGTTIQVPALAREGALLEVEAIALLPVKQPRE
jgi:enamine deaminase RidA (YjgF/YER057c/UK114 family)